MPEETPSEERAYSFDVYLEHAKYLVDYQWRRSGSFETRAMALLSTDAVLLALLVPLHADHQFHGWGAATAMASTVLIVVSAGVAAFGLFPRKVGAPDVEGFHKSYLAYRAAPKPSRAMTEEQLTGHLIGPPGHASILQALGKDATRRGRAVAVSAMLLVTGMVCLAVAFGYLTVES